MHKVSKNEGVSAVIAVILMVAITVVLAGVLYVWVMGMADTNTSTSKIIGVKKDGNSNGYQQLTVASTSGSATRISDITLKIKRSGAAVTVADFNTATINTTANYVKYSVDTNGDSEPDFIIYDNDNDGMITQGDTILIDADDIETGDVLDATLSDNTVTLTRF